MFRVRKRLCIFPKVLRIETKRITEKDEYMVPISLSMCLCLEKLSQDRTQAICINLYISDFEIVIRHFEDYDFISDVLGSRKLL